MSDEIGSSNVSWIEDSSWPEVEQAIEHGAIAILPIGAAAKEHGRHLPLNTDYLQARYLADTVAKSVSALIWPVVSYGYYPVFIDYPGSVSIKAATFASIVQDILACIAYSGVKSTYILNTGISTIKPLERLLVDDSAEHTVRLLNVYSGPRFTSASAALVEQEHGGHADEIETSLMMAINKQSVMMDRAKAQITPIHRGVFNRTDSEQALSLIHI